MKTIPRFLTSLFLFLILVLGVSQLTTTAYSGNCPANQCGISFLFCPEVIDTCWQGSQQMYVYEVHGHPSVTECYSATDFSQ